MGTTLGRPILSCQTKLFSNQRLCIKEPPSASSTLFPTNVQRWVFLLKTQQHCFQGKGGGKNHAPTATRYSLEKYSPSTQAFCPRLYQKTVPVAVNISESAWRRWIISFCGWGNDCLLSHGDCSQWSYSDILLSTGSQPTWAHMRSVEFLWKDTVGAAWKEEREITQLSSAKRLNLPETDEMVF